MLERRHFLKLLVGAIPSVALFQRLTAARPTVQRRAILLKEVNIAGVPYHDASEPSVLAKLEVGERVILRREPENPYDNMAIAIHTLRGDMLGYVPRIQNRTMARIADQGIELRGWLVKVDTSASAWDQLRVRVEQLI
jgi:hypothetical protein